ncbi:MAG: hypothetical protein GY774_37995 [Planctomycetes bacterium]|nr:hypothetical protein [Planctomycetota bacterium]
MADETETLPVSISWKLITASPDMMDTTFCNKKFPFAWRSSLAISAYEPNPEDLPEKLCGEKITFLKVTCSVTGYQPSKTDTEEGYVSFPNIPTEELDRIIGEYFACYGVLLNIAVFPRSEEEIRLRDYPRIIDFEPKNRDLYQIASETGEILTASRSGVKTDKTLKHTETSETGLDLNAKVGKKDSWEVGGKLTHKWGETDVDSWQVQPDGSRERKETEGAKTDISQMYNLLTGYHAGTNRAVFLMLPRPHILQPTDRRTFVQGLRVIEGMQEFFLVVARPDDQDSFCVEAFLETGHLPEEVEIEEFPVEYDKQEDEWSTGDLLVDRPDVCPGGCAHRNAPGTPLTREAPAGYVFDRTEAAGLGTEVIANNSDNWVKQSNHLITQIKLLGETTAEISIRVRPEATGLFGSGKNKVNLTFKSYYRSINPKEPNREERVTTPFLITSRGLCCCIGIRDGCVEYVPRRPDIEMAPQPGDWIVDERLIALPRALVDPVSRGDTRMPATKEILKQIQFALSSSWRRRTRRPFGEVSFIDSNYFEKQVTRFLQQSELKKSLNEFDDIPRGVVDALGETFSVGEAVDMDLSSFAAATNLSFSDALDVRRKLLGMPQRTRQKE